MSALVMLEHGRLDDPVTVSREAAAARKMHLRLRAGHIFRLDDLVKAMLITSANDACLAAAIHVGGSEDKFVDLMNAKARALGLLIPTSVMRVVLIRPRTIQRPRIWSPSRNWPFSIHCSVPMSKRNEAFSPL